MNIADKLNEIKSKLEDLRKFKITVGVQDEEGTNRLGNKVSGSEMVDGSKLKYTDLARIHEYGAPKARIPERKFIRSIKDSIGAQRDRKNKLNQLSAGYLSGDITLDEVYDETGSFVVKQIVQNMGVGTAKLKDSTIKNRKKSTSDIPLVDTGALSNHVTYRRGDKN